MAHTSHSIRVAKKPRIIGVLGGLGPATTAKFYLQLTRDLMAGDERPRLCIWNVAVHTQAEERFIKHGSDTEHFVERLREGARALERAGCSSIVLPCNTVA